MLWASGTHINVPTGLTLHENRIQTPFSAVASLNTTPTNQSGALFRDRHISINWKNVMEEATASFMPFRSMLQAFGIRQVFLLGSGDLRMASWKSLGFLWSEVVPS